jgi:hypothetical protein
VYTAYSFIGVPGTVTTRVPASFTIDGRTYTFTYIATTQAEREQGLMNKRITDTTTMLFAFPSPVAQPFWMLDTNTSLDIIWVSASGNAGTVVSLVSGAQPCYDSSACTIYSPSASANYVIEAKAGFAAANDIHTGTTIQFS